MGITELRQEIVGRVKPHAVVIDGHPSRLAFWSDVFGLLALAALVATIVSGGILALQGTSWLYFSTASHYARSLHFWMRQLFLTLVVVHLLGEMFIAMLRQRRIASWVTGIGALVASVGMMFTGYLVLPNAGSEWVPSAPNGGHSLIGIGVFFHSLNISRSASLLMGMWSLVFGVFLIWHFILVHRQPARPL